jgi:hypothetical protein
MGKMSYSEQLKRPEWQRKRLEVLNAAGWKCQHCGANDSMLHVHHKRYVKGCVAWEYAASDLESLCEACHSEAHETKELIDEILAGLPTAMWMDAASLLVGWASGVVDSELSSRAYDAFTEEAGLLASACKNLSIYEVIELRAKAEEMAKGRESFDAFK